MNKILLFFLLIICGIANAQHTAPLIGAGVDKTVNLPINTTSVTGTSTLYDNATATYSWTKLRTPGMPVRRITIVGSSVSAGFGVGATEGYVYQLKQFYKGLIMLDTIYNLAVSGQTVFDCPLTTALNKGADIVGVYYGSNGYRVADGFTITQICNRYREIRDSIINRGKDYFFIGTQPRDEWGATDRARLVEINDSVRNIAGVRFIDIDKVLRNQTNNNLKTEYQLGDGIHPNAAGQTQIYNTVRAHNVFRFIAAAFDKIRTSTSLTTNIDSISRKGLHLYQLGAIDSFGFGGSDVVQVNATSACGGTAYRPTPDAGDRGYYDASPLGPGDTLYLEGGKIFSYVAVISRNGTAACPIIVMNDKGVGTLTRDQMAFDYSSYISVTGTGTKDAKGILIQGRGTDTLWNGNFGVAINIGSKNIRIEHTEIRNVGVGIKVGPDATCDQNYNYPLFVHDSIIVNDNKIVRIWNEGMYLGNTSPDNEPSGPGSYDPRPITCPVVGTVYYKPARMGNVKVYNNFVDSTGRGGIQLAAASTGISEVYNNIVKHSGINGDDAQGTAISTGAYTRAKIFNNLITNTYTWGVAILGANGTNFTQEITGNTIDSSGFLTYYDLSATGRTEVKLSIEPTFTNTLPWPHNIFAKTTDNKIIDSTRFLISNNTFIKRKSVWNIAFLDNQNTFHEVGNVICQNLNVPTAATSVNLEGPNPVLYSITCLINNFRKVKLKRKI